MTEPTYRGQLEQVDPNQKTWGADVEKVTRVAMEGEKNQGEVIRKWFKYSPKRIFRDAILRVPLDCSETQPKMEIRQFPWHLNIPDRVHTYGVVWATSPTRATVPRSFVDLNPRPKRPIRASNHYHSVLRSQRHRNFRVQGLACSCGDIVQNAEVSSRRRGESKTSNEEAVWRVGI